VYSTRTRVHARISNGQPRDDPRAEVGEDVRVGVGVGVRIGAVECQLYSTGPTWTPTPTRTSSPTSPTRALFLARMTVRDARACTRVTRVLYTINCRVHVYKITR